MAGISLKMPDSLAAEVAATAEHRGVSKSALIRQAIETFLHRGEPLRPRSALSLVADLAGACEGPEELSVDRKHPGGSSE